MKHSKNPAGESLTGNIVFTGFDKDEANTYLKYLSAKLISENTDFKCREMPGSRKAMMNLHIRIGNTCISPEIMPGGADILISGNAYEAVRNIDYLKFGGLIIMPECGQKLTETPAFPKENETNGADDDIHFSEEECMRFIYGAAAPNTVILVNNNRKTGRHFILHLYEMTYEILRKRENEIDN